MATKGGDEPVTPELGHILEFKEFNAVLAKLDRTELYRHPMLSDPGALGEWLHGLGMEDGAADGLNDHLNGHIGKHPLREALTAGAWFALLRSAHDEYPPKFFLRVGSSYGVLISRPRADAGIVVVVNVEPSWPHLPVGRSVPNTGFSKLKADDPARDLQVLDIDHEMMALHSEAEACGMWIGAPALMM